jgi:uncharacterized protein
MSKRFPNRLDPWHFADLGREISGSLLLRDLVRLRDCLLDTDGKVCFELRFSRDRRRYARVDGAIQTQVSLECQRCLGKLVFPIEKQFSVAFVQGIDEAERLPETLEPCLVEEGRVNLQELIEDEILLALPQVPLHDVNVCQQPRSAFSEEIAFESISDEQEADHPFSILERLKREKH